MSAVFAPVAETDRVALVDFMFAHAKIMMFPLTNLTRYGLGGDHPRAMHVWAFKRDGQITDVLSVSQEGIIFPCCPNGHWATAADTLRGLRIKGFIGDQAQVSSLRAAIGMTQRAQRDVSEPSFVLDTDVLKMPDTSGFRLCSLGAAPRELMVGWRANYEVETLHVARNVAELQADQRIRDFIAADTHRVLIKDGAPVSTTGFNAALPEIVQIGGVYTPPALRGRGYARIALAMHLTEVAARGVTKAVLSAANESAARAYRALGFERAGDFAMVVYETPQVAHV